MFQPSANNVCTAALATISNTPLAIADMCCYLGSHSRIQHTLFLDTKLQLDCPMLRKWLWGDRGICIDTKVAVYDVVVLTSLLYGS